MKSRKGNALVIFIVMVNLVGLGFSFLIQNFTALPDFISVAIGYTASVLFLFMMGSIL